MTQKRGSAQVHVRAASRNGSGVEPPAAALSPNGHPSDTDLPSASAVQQALSDDPLDLERMRISPAQFTALVGIRTAHVRVGRPDNQDFFRVHGDPAFALDTYLLHLKADREFYFVARPLWNDPRVFKELKLCRLYYYVHLSRAVGLWPVQLPDEAGNHNSWHESAMAVAELSKGKWLRLVSGAGGYSIIEGPIDDEPAWPAMDFQEVIRVAFRSKTIADPDHPKLKQLRGEITAQMVGLP